MRAPPTLQVCDFGLSRGAAFLTAKMTRVGSVQWAAPEVLLGVAYGQRADVWSFGVVIWELLVGLVPYGSAGRVEVARGVASGELRLPVPPMEPHRCPEQLLRLLDDCFTPPADRPEFSDVVNILDVCKSRLATH